MVIIYDSALTEPPSSIHCFRDVTLYNKIFLDNDNLIRCPKGTRSIYWKWIKSYGAHDFIDDLLIVNEEEKGLSVGDNKDIKCNVINEFNYGEIIRMLKYV